MKSGGITIRCGSWVPPAGICRSLEADEGLDLGAEARASRFLGLGLPKPPEASLMPLDQGGRFGVYQDIAASWAKAVQYHPEETISLGEPGILLSALVHPELLAQSQVLGG